jgi:flagellar motor switch protein FliM
MTSECLGLQTNPQFVTIVTAPVSVMKISIDITAEAFSGRCFFCISNSRVEPIKDKLYFDIELEKQETNQRVDNLKAVMTDSRVQLRAEMRTEQTSTGQLMGLEVGNVITLDNSVSGEIHVIARYRQVRVNANTRDGGKRVTEEVEFQQPEAGRPDAERRRNNARTL